MWLTTRTKNFLTAALLALAPPLLLGLASAQAGAADLAAGVQLTEPGSAIIIFYDGAIDNDGSVAGEYLMSPIGSPFVGTFTGLLDAAGVLTLDFHSVWLRDNPDARVILAFDRVVVDTKTGTATAYSNGSVYYDGRGHVRIRD